MSSPTSRSLEMLRELGFLAQVVEHFNPHVRIRQDLFGCIDILAAREGVGILAVQACARASHAARRTKSLSEPKLLTFLAAGGRFEVWSWAKIGKAGEPKRWDCWREEIRLQDMNAEAPPAIEEDGCEITTPMPKRCRHWPCDGRVKRLGGFYRCLKCEASYGPVAKRVKKVEGGLFA